MRHYLTLIILLLSISQINAQQVIHVKDFSEKYAAKILPSDIPGDNEYFSTAYVSIYDKSTGLEVIRDTIEIDIDYEMADGDSIKSNIVEMPYGDQSVIICDDFNCDEQEDLAIKIGNLSCYGGPAYNVYISKNGELKLHDEFSRLAQEYCGFFEYDCDQKEIHTMTKSGCCWHQFSTYSIIEGEPVVKEVIVMDGAWGSFPIGTTTTWDAGEETVREFLLTEYIEDAFSFRLQDRNKQVYLFRNIHGALVYCFINDDEEIEFSFTDEFILTKEANKNILSFSNASAQYSIYCSDKEVGIIVKTKGKSYDMKGDIESLQNSLDMFYNEEIDNLQISQ